MKSGAVPVRTRLTDWVLGRPLATGEAEKEQIGPIAGIPILGLDALASAAYGPEAALTLLIPLGFVGLRYVGLISALIVVILLTVYFSYRQTIAAYPGGGGSYTVAKENLGAHAGLLAGAALALDYVLNVAVGISAGVGALVSAVPFLLPHLLALCLAILALLALLNLRGVRESGFAFMLPTYCFVGTLGAVLVIGVVKSWLAGGHPAAVVPPPSLPPVVQGAGIWILVRAFASGCTAMTGVEAVSNGVPLFRKPTIALAQRTLTAIIAILVALLLGVAYLSRVYGIVATAPGEKGYDSILSMITGAVVGRGAFYYVTIGSVVSVLALSANTSFADFPRLCRVLADDGYLPERFAVRGRRLVYSGGIVILTVLAGALLLAFGGVTDRLIPLFAIGAFLAFTLSQAGMVRHWQKEGGREARHSLVVNALGALATGVTLVVVAVSKFAEGAWLTVVAVPLLVGLFTGVRRHYLAVQEEIATSEPMDIPERIEPVVVVAVGSWSKVAQRGLKFGLRLSSIVHVVQITTETDATIELFRDTWELLVVSRARAAHIAEPKLVVLTSDYRRFFQPFLEYVKQLERDHPDRDIVVVIADLVMNKWYEGLLHNNRGALLRTLLRRRCGPRVVVVNTPYRLRA